ncbi:MAG: hypothetical protein Q7U11_09150 [Phenylobacterium sp.]|uniref:hypothetical protein n=1 Tax=Phenylobacterium sp. TaxID=1871053 RepID=UPI002715F671|nr:hypothetical protein [Phenylobacterium sp.]MDO9246623.1 hypothetical protein [Phenylobacterium sp.]MDP3867762.1 hypothetical protein [Phenylobacterium sp.]
MNRTVPAAAVLALMAFAACAPKAEKTVAAIDPTTSATGTPPAMAEHRTLDGMLARARERFATADLNQDGKVTTEELEQGRADREVSGPRWGAGGRLMRADTDTDGEVTLADVEAHTRERFARLDTDKDIVVSPGETRAALQPAN